MVKYEPIEQALLGAKPLDQGWATACAFALQLNDEVNFGSAEYLQKVVWAAQLRPAPSRCC